jgi:Zn-dependent protease
MMRRPTGGGFDPTTLIILSLLFIGPSLLRGRPDTSMETITVYLISAVIAVTVHEFMHAWTAMQLGDDTAMQMGRVTLNPVAHFDPFGFLGFILIAFGFSTVAWGRPVPVVMNRLRGDFDRRKLGMLLIAIAGPISNFAMAAVAVGALRLFSQGDTDLGYTGFFLTRFAYLNMGMAAFNLIPLPPLDGSRVLSGLLPSFWFPFFSKLEVAGLVTPFLLIFADGQLDLGLYDAMVGPPFRALIDLFTNATFVEYFYRF